ncbi:hypothetical protein HD806DRAFT_491523 [Xylariaceae sp. AK1471]|nr:hypothetical protein HD806DRAFT_491523 [Xylariaceae sp. AK1471]
MADDSRSSLLHFPARPRDVKRQNQTPHPGKFEHFIRNKVGIFQRKPPGPSQYDQGEDRYKPKHETAREDLKKILLAHDDHVGTTLKAKECSWDTVFEQMAQAARLKSSQGDLGGPTLPVGIRIASETIDIFPEEFGLGVIKGGLALVFEACQRRSESRQKIMDAFETVPDAILTINTAYILLGAEEDDKDLQRTFFATLLEDLPFLIQKLLGKEIWYKKIASALLLHIPEMLAIDDILSDWTTKMANLTERVERMKIKILSKLGLKIDDVKHQVDSSEKNIIAQIKSSEKTLKDEVMNSETGIIALWSQSTELQRFIMTQVQNMNEWKTQISGFIADQASTAAMTGLIREIQNTYQRDKKKWEQQLQQKEEELKEKEKYWNQERGQFHQEIEHSHENETQLRHDRELYRRENSKLQVHNRELSRQVSSQSMRDEVHGPSGTTVPVTPIQLLGVIGVSLTAMWRDLDRVVQQSVHFDAESQGKARWLITTSEFGAWIQGRQSSILLADGATTSQVLFVSPMSGLCAALASSLADENAGTITLSFFVGLHVGTDRTDHGLDGPQGMMRSLIAQLLSSSLLSPNLEFQTHEDLEAYRGHDLKSLCKLFVHLVQQLPRGVDVFCIIDGISWYEQDSWLTGLRYVTGMFEYLVEQLDPRCMAILKVLMTSHGRSTEIVHRTRAPNKRQFWRHVTLVAGHVNSRVSIGRLQQKSHGSN